MSKMGEKRMAPAQAERLYIAAMHDGEKGHAGLMTPRNRTERVEAAADGASAKNISSIMSAQVEALATIKRLEAQVAALVQAGKQGAA